MAFSRDLGERYSPLYFFNAFAAGGLAVSFFMYLFWMAHVTLSSMPTVGVLYSLAVDTGLVESAISLVSLAGFLFFTVQHVFLLRWNLVNFKRWKQTQTYAAFEKSSDKSVLMTIPLTLALSLLLGLIFLCMTLPFIFTLIEFVLGLGLACFVFLGWHAIKIHYENFLSMTREVLPPEEVRSNNLGQMISILSFLMMSVGFAAVSATSTIKITLFISFMGAALFLALALIVALISFLPKIGSLLDKRLPPEASPLLWFATSLLGLFFLTWHYLKVTLSTAFGGANDPAQTFSCLSFVFVVSFVFGGLGRATLIGHGLLDQLLKGKIYSAGLYGVVCPSLLLLILGHYFINTLVQTGLLQPWSLYYFVFYLPLLVVHALIIRLYMSLNAKLFASKAPNKPTTLR